MKKTARIIFSVATTLFTALSTFAQTPFVQWDKTIGGSDRDHLNSFAPALDGGYIIGGTSNSGISGNKTAATVGGNDYWIVKINANGAIEWQKTYGGKGEDLLRSVKPTLDGGYIVGGTSNSGKEGDKAEASRGKDDYWILKLDKKGDIEWQKTLGGNNYDQLAVVYPTIDGGYIAGGTSSSTPSGEKTGAKKGADPRNPDEAADYWIVKLDKNGTIQWDKTYGGGAGSARFHDLALTKDGYLLAGYSMSDKANDKSEDSRGAYDYWVIKIDFTGNVKWDKTIGGKSSDQLQVAIPTNDNGFLLGGSSSSDISGEKTANAYKNSTDYWIVKLSATGSIEWDKTIGSDGSENLNSLAVAKEGGYLIGGQSSGKMSGDKSEDVRTINGTNYWLVKTDDKGKVEWEKTIGAQNDLNPIAFPASDDGYIIAGSSNANKQHDKSENSRGGFDFWVVKLGACKEVTTDVKASICAGETYTLPWGNKVSKAGTYRDTLSAISGCDSFVVTHLEVHSPIEKEVEVSICEGENYPLPDGSSAKDEGDYEIVLQSVVTGCDSVIITTVRKVVIDTTVTVTSTTLAAQQIPNATYQWYDCANGSAIEGEDQSIFEAKVNGQYKVVITLGDCVDSSFCHEINSHVGINDIDGQNSLSIYPNPASTTVHLLQASRGAFIAYAVLTDMNGKMVGEYKAINSRSAQIDVEALAGGSYVLKMVLADGTTLYERLAIVSD